MAKVGNKSENGSQAEDFSASFLYPFNFYHTTKRYIIYQQLNEND